VSFLGRVARLLRQSRIRLPRSRFDPHTLGPGDGLQLGSETWRVRSKSCRSGRVSYQLARVAVNRTVGTASASLESPRRAGAPWTLRRGASELPLSPEDLLVYRSESRLSATSA